MGILDDIKDAGKAVWDHTGGKIIHEGGKIIHKGGDVFHTGGGGNPFHDVDDFLKDHDPSKALGDIVNDMTDVFGNIVKSVEDQTGDVIHSVEDQTGDILHGVGDEIGNAWKGLEHTGIFNAVGDISHTFEGLAEESEELFETLVTLGKDLIHLLPRILDDVAKLLEMTVRGVLNTVETFEQHPNYVYYLLGFIAIGWFVKDNALLMSRK